MFNDGQDTWKSYAAGVESGLAFGSVSVPAALLLEYRTIGLNEMELALLLQLLAYKQVEGTEFPMMDELAERLSLSKKEVQNVLSRLIKDQFIFIEELYNRQTGLRSERYVLAGVYRELGKVITEQDRRAFSRTKAPADSTLIHASSVDSSHLDLFTIFEKEFGRPLSPMEFETINSWLDTDHYQEELILAALKEAVFAGKLAFRYIDRILLEWSRNRVTTLEEARTFSQKFRNKT